MSDESEEFDVSIGAGIVEAELELDLRERLRINPLMLQPEFVRIPMHIAVLGKRHGEAVENRLRAKTRSKKLWGLMLMQARDDLEQENDRKQQVEYDTAEREKRKALDVRVRITESMVDSRAWQYPVWLAAQDDEAAAERREVAAKANFEAIRAKKDALVQLGATERAEMERDPIVRDRAREAERIRRERSSDG